MATGFQPFDDLLNSMGNAGGNFMKGFNLTAGTPAGAPGLAAVPSGRAAAAGRFLGSGMQAPGLGVTSAALGGLGAAMQGQGAGGIIGSTVGGLGGGMATTKLNELIGKSALDPRLKLLAMGANSLITPMIATSLGGKAGEAAASGVSTLAGKAGDVLQATANQQLNPMGLLNSTEQATEKILEMAEELRKKFGDDVAKEYLQRAAAMNDLADYEAKRAAITTQVAPVRTAGRLAEMSLQGKMGLANTGLVGMNQALSNITAQNPYATMLVS